MRVPTRHVVWNARVVKRRAAWQVKAEVREAQKKLKQLGVAPPPPKGKPVRADIMKPGTYHALPPRLEDLEHYAGQLRALLERHATRWAGKAFLHNVLAAALDAAPEQERLDRPHGHVTARPVIDNRGYLALALLAADTVAPYVSAAEKKQFDRWLELGRRVAGGAELSEGDEALLDREVPLVRQPSRALSRNFTAASATLRVAQGVGLEAEQAEAHNVGGKGAREACAAAVTLLVKPGEAKRFLERLDALIQLEDAKLQFSKVSVQPSSALVAARWRGAEKGKGSHWLVELANGRFAFLWKVRGMWRLVEGTRDDAIASVPDAHLADAVKALNR